MQLLCVDIGSSRAKAALFRDHPSGVPERLLLVERESRAPGPDGLVDLALLETDLRVLIRSAGESAADNPAIGRLQPDALAITSIYGHVLIDADGEPCGPGLAWNWRPGPGAHARLAERFGTPVDGAWGDALRGPGPDTLASRLAWLAGERPSGREHGTRIAGIKDYLVARLTGVWAADPTLRDYLGAPGSALDSLCADAGVRLVPEESVLALGACLLPEPASDCGLPAGTPVLRGCTDGSAAMYGLGVLGRGVVAAVAGSTDVVMAELPRRPGSPARFGGGSTRSAVGTWLVGGSTAAAGAALRWLDSLLSPGPRSWWEVEPGSEGILAGSGLGGERAPFPGCPGAFFAGLQAGHDGAALQRAMREAVCMRFARLVEAVRSQAPGVRQIVLGGGRVQTDEARELDRLRAALSPLPIVRAREEQSSLMGLALLALVAAEGGGYEEALRRRSEALAGHADAVPSDTRLREQMAPVREAWTRHMKEAT